MARGRGGDEPVTVDAPAVITTKCVREVLEVDARLDGVVGAWENYGNVKGSNELGDMNLAALLGTQHYGDAEVERFAAFGGEEVTRVGYGNALEYGSSVADAYLGHMREDQVMQAILRFARGGSGALVFAHTSALRGDLPVVGRGEVIRSWSEAGTNVARQLQRTGGEELKASDVADDAGVSTRHARRILNEFATAGYVEKHERDEGLAHGYSAVDEPGAGEVEINTEVETEALGTLDEAGSNVTYTTNVRVHGVNEADPPGIDAQGSELPAPSSSDAVDRGVAGGDRPPNDD